MVAPWDPLSQVDDLVCSRGQIQFLTVGARKITTTFTNTTRRACQATERTHWQHVLLVTWTRLATTAKLTPTGGDQDGSLANGR